MQETNIYKDEDTRVAVTYDKEELKSLRRRIISKLAEADHFETKAPEPSYYSPKMNPDIRKRKDIQIKNFKEWYEPWIDVWELYCSSYDRVTVPYLARLISELLDGNYEAADQILDAEVGSEYIPIRETIEEYVRLIANYKEYHSKYPSPRASLGHEGEAKVAEKNIRRYIDILSDEEYVDKFRPYYAAAKEIISVRELEDDEAVEEKPATLRMINKGTKK